MSLLDKLKEKEIKYKEQLDIYNKWVYITYCEYLDIYKKKSEYLDEFHCIDYRYSKLVNIFEILENQKYIYFILDTKDLKNCIKSNYMIMYLNTLVEDSLTDMIRSIGEELHAYYICIENFISSYRIIELCTGISVIVKER